MNHPNFLTSSVLTAAGFRHAFFTRLGGVSEGPYQSLNFSYSVGDLASSVESNLRAAAGALGIPLSRLGWLAQVHGREVRLLGPGQEPEQARAWEGDGIATAVAGVGCGVRVADCVPILIAERQSGMVAAVHAGWRGVVARVLEAAFATLRKELGCAGDWAVAIGPHISRSAFEVSEEVATLLLGSASGAERAVDRHLGARPFVDLGRILRAQLGELGIREDQIDEVGGCTVGDPERFFSYRRDGPRSGRHLAAIVCRGRKY